MSVETGRAARTVEAVAGLAGALAELGVLAIDADGRALAVRQTDLPRELLGAAPGACFRWAGGEVRTVHGGFEWRAEPAQAAVIRAALGGGAPP